MGGWFESGRRVVIAGDIFDVAFDFLAEVVDFLVGAFFAVGFLVVAFLVAGFFVFVAMILLLCCPSDNLFIFSDLESLDSKKVS